MDIKHVDQSYYVSPQITPDDVSSIAAEGFSTIICNRPDAEVPSDLQAEKVRAAAEAQGLAFHDLPLTHQTMTPDNIEAQMALVQAGGDKVLAYCASGTRCTVIWSLAQALQGTLTPDETLSRAAAAGYALDGLRPQLELLHRR